MTIRYKFDHLIDEDSLDKDEAREFLGFLQIERQRHVADMLSCDENAQYFTVDGKMVLAFAWKSSSIRHQDDIDMITGTIDKLQTKWGL